MRSKIFAITGCLMLSTQMVLAQPGYDPYARGSYESYQGDRRPQGDRQGRSYAAECRNSQQNKQMTNAAIGAAAGGLLGNQVAGRGNRTGGTIAGVLLGAVAGYALTGDMDCGDRYYAEPVYQQGLEGPIGRRSEWRNHRDNDRGTFTPTREYQRDRYTCRDYTATNYRDGRPTRRNGSACRYEDGSWYFQ